MIILVTIPVLNCLLGIKSYLKAGIDPQKLVVAQPWYGYDYKCTNYPKSGHCIIKKDSFSSSKANATKAKPNVSRFPFIIPDDDWKSDANQASITFGGICKLLRNHTRKWNNATLTPYLDYKRYSGDYHQVCYDDAESLKLKSEYVFSMNCRGISAWTVDFPDYEEFPKESAGIWEGLTYGLEKKIALERSMLN